MKKRLDFIISEDNIERTIFRFYPRRSHVHGFHDECPKSWDAVYKVYYAWSVIKQFRWDETEEWESYELFEMPCDECSAIGYIPSAINDLTIGNKTNLYAMGYGANWEIEYLTADEKFNIKPRYEFIIWNNFTHQGYKFILSEEETKQFKKYIEYIQEYMLAHSEPI